DKLTQSHPCKSLYSCPKTTHRSLSTALHTKAFNRTAKAQRCISKPGPRPDPVSEQSGQFFRGGTQKNRNTTSSRQQPPQSENSFTKFRGDGARMKCPYPAPIKLWPSSKFLLNAQDVEAMGGMDFDGANCDCCVCGVDHPWCDVPVCPVL